MGSTFYKRSKRVYTCYYSGFSFTQAMIGTVFWGPNSVLLVCMLSKGALNGPFLTL